MIRVIQMDRLTFGDGPSPCVAIATLHKTAEDFAKDKPAVKETIVNGFYVDDLADSERTINVANKKASDLVEVLGKGNFVLRKWLSNKEDFKLDKSEDRCTSVLGLKWDTKKDVLSVKPGPSKITEKLTKRALLARLAQIYSPLGLVSPFLVKGKIRLAKLHLLGAGWDDSLQDAAGPLWEEESKWWTDWMDAIPKLSEVEFPRCMSPNGTEVAERQLHVFGDASEHAFGAAAYIRSKYKDESVVINLAMAKTRVAPRKAISVAKLELQAAVLATRLGKYVQEAVRYKFDRRVFWTDSTVVRHWVRQTSSFFKTFCSVRIGEIQTETEPSEWRYVPGAQNVADEATRSELCDEVISERWIHGPEFLYKPEEQWPKDLEFKVVTEEIRPKYDFSNFPAVMEPPEGDWFNPETYGSFTKAARVLAWVNRFVQSARGEKPSTSGLTHTEIQKAKLQLIRQAQAKDYSEEIGSLLGGTQVKKSSHLLKLHPILDENKTLRVGGRIGESDLPYDAKHPAILHPRNPLSRLIIEEVHLRFHHAGAEYVLGQLRQNYWVVHGRELVVKVGRDCPVCRRRFTQPGTQLMAELPKSRVTPSPPFYRTSVDFFGPYEVRVSRNKVEKRYGAIFACMTTRAVHLEVAQSLSTPDFLNTLRTFINIRGEPKFLYSDNGTNFIGAEKELKRRLEEIGESEEFQRQVVERGIHWKFQPPAAPHFGGIHESLVKSVKRALYGAMTEAQRRRNLTESELRTLLSEVMGFLNSRPLTYAGGDPKDLVALTPNHFLLQRANASVPPGLQDASSLRKGYEFVQSLANKVWTLWKTQYLPTLLARSKWNTVERNLEKDDVVLIVDKNTPRGQWRWGPVIEVVPGRDGLVRHARVKTSLGECVRPVTKLCLLEKNDRDTRK